MSRYVYLLLGLIVAFCIASSFVHAVEIRFADRVSLHSAQPTEVTITGDKLRGEDGDIAKLWTSFPAKVEPVDKENKDRNVVRYRITPSQPIGGLVAIRAYDNQSLSQALLFSVEDIPISNLPAPADPPVQIPAVFDCTSEGLGHRSIAFECKKGQKFVAEIVGARIGSEIDALLILQDDQHKELAFADDHEVIGSDPILQWTATYSGVHHLIAQDVEYRGGMRMQVRITDRSAAATCFPSAIRVGESRRVQQSIVANVVPNVDPESILAKGRFDAGITFLNQPSVIASLTQTELPIYVQREQSRNEVPVPAVFCGRIDQANEFDSVFVSANKSDSIIIQFLKSDRPFVGVVELLKDDKEVAKQHWGSDPNGSLRFKVNEDSEYEIRIRDALGRSGQGYEYAMSAENTFMPANLRISQARENKKRRNDKLHRQTWHAPETLPVFVHCDRRGYNGPWAVVAQLDGQACKVDVTVSKNKNELEIEIHLPDDSKKVSEPTIAHLQIFGQGTVDGRSVKIPLDLKDHVKRDFPSMQFTPSIVGSQIAVLIIPEATEQKK